MKVFVSRSIPPEGLTALEAATGLEVSRNSQDQGLSPAELIKASQEAEGLLCLLTDKIDANFMAACPKLKVISNMAVGFNNIEVEAATRRGILVTNTPGVLTGATADLTFALLLAVARRLGEGERLVRSGGWEGWGPLQLLGGEVSGKTLGLIGMGRIGKAVARRAAGFDMKVQYYSRHRVAPDPESDPASNPAIRLVELEELLRTSDFVSLHAPYNPETHHLINAERLSWLKPSAYLINTSRGPLVDETALVAALQTQKLAGAGLDVYELEPKLAEGLAELENVVLAPHLGSATHQTRGEMARLAATNLVQSLQGQRHPNEVNPAALDKRA